MEKKNIPVREKSMQEWPGVSGEQKEIRLGRRIELRWETEK